MESKNIKQNQIFFQENLKGRKMLKWDQDHYLLWKLDNQDPIILARLSTLIILLKKIKNIRQLRRIRLIQKWVILLWRWYGQRRFRGSDRWEPKPTRSLTRLKQKQITEKQRSYYDAGISAEVITKDIPGLIPKTIYNHY